MSSLTNRRIRLVRLAHVYYSHRDITKAHQFLADFGFEKINQVDNKTFYRGTGTEPFVYCAVESSDDSFGGAAFVVESLDDLKYAASTLPGATPVTEMETEPGGGYMVTFYDPVDNFPFHLLYGQKEADALPKSLPERDVNFPTHKNRPGNTFQRFEKGPAPVHKLGHFGMVVTDFKKAFEFYTSKFNFKPSDVVYNDSGHDITTFLHLDRGKELVDHHCFFFFEGPKSHVHHSSYETHDFDTQLLGHHWLRERGYENCWGVGRHVMGSQIFDYWFDTSGFIMEHYVDGDLVDDAYPTNRQKASPDNLHVWGPDVPSSFLS